MNTSSLHHLAQVCRALEKGAYDMALREISLAATRAASGVEGHASGEVRELVAAFEGMLTYVLRREKGLAHSLDVLDKDKKRLAANLARCISMRRLIGQSAAIQELQAQVQKVAATSATVFLSGETGTGKGLVAHVLHYSGARAAKPFVAVNCAAIPASLLESELFGIEKGVASGVNARGGRFEQAHGGTLFLDEIGDMPLESQAKILHVLESSQVERVGGRNPVTVDVRIIAATHRSLEQRIEQGLFRQDLFFRLHVLALRVPSLREREGDIALLSRYFLLDCARRHNLPSPQIHPEALCLLERYPWPGNVRELQNEMERAVIMSQRGVIMPEDLSASIRTCTAPNLTPLSSSTCIVTPPSQPWGQCLLAEATEIAEMLKAAGGNKTKAAALLGLSREGLRKKILRLRTKGTVVEGFPAL